MTASSTLHESVRVHISEAETDKEFRQWVRGEFQHMREQQKRTNEALDLILAAMKLEEADGG